MPNARQLPSLNQPAESDDAIEALARRSYEGCHPNDTFEDLKRRAGMTRLDAGLLRGWIRAAQCGALGTPEDGFPQAAGGPGTPTA
jgi:hypothetical protein